MGLSTRSDLEDVQSDYNINVENRLNILNMHEKDSGARERDRRHCENCNINKCSIKLEEGKIQVAFRTRYHGSQKKRWKLKHLGSRKSV